MVSSTTLTFLIGQKRNDADVLFSNKRYVAAVYLMGYAVEIALKKRICDFLGFVNGFPETKPEFQACVALLRANNRTPATAGASLTFTNVTEIRNHNLSKLLRYSGREVKIQSAFSNDWTNIIGWHPEKRYQRYQLSKTDAVSFIKSAKIIIREIA
jgi:HEPN domain-containing protein